MNDKTRRGESGDGRAPPRTPIHAPKKPTHEKDQGFNESHGYPPGHGGPTGPGDTPATGDADAHDASRRSQADTHPDSRV